MGMDISRPLESSNLMHGIIACHLMPGERKGRGAWISAYQAITLVLSITMICRNFHSPSQKAFCHVQRHLNLVYLSNFTFMDATRASCLPPCVSFTRLPNWYKFRYGSKQFVRSNCGDVSRTPPASLKPSVEGCGIRGITHLTKAA